MELFPRRIFARTIRLIGVVYTPHISTRRFSHNLYAIQAGLTCGRMADNPLLLVVSVVTREILADIGGSVSKRIVTLC